VVRSRIIAFVALGAMLLVAVTVSEGSIVTVTFTGDNVVQAFWKNGSNPQEIDISGLPNTDNWTIADTTTVDLANGQYQILFRVHQDGTFGSANPAGFLAQITGSGLIVTSEEWEYVSAVGTSSPPGNDAGWQLVREWGANKANGGPGGQNTIWYNVKGGPIADISADAQWIWGGSNFAETAPAPISEEWFRTSFAVPLQEIPEPTTLAIWSLLGGLGLAFGWYRTRKR